MSAAPILAVVDKTREYPAVVENWYDGDTLTASVNLGLGVWMRGQKFRLCGIDAPEIRGGDEDSKLHAQHAKRFVLENAPIGSAVIVRTFHGDRKEKYGRWIATVLVPPAPAAASSQMMNLNHELIGRGLAREVAEWGDS